MKRFLAQTGLVIAIAVAAAAADPIPLTAYYFPRPETCTVMVDFQKARSRVAAFSSQERVIAIVAAMAAELEKNGRDKCAGAARVRLIAVFIQGVDMYGRPDFGTRTNLLKLEGAAARLKNLAQAGDKLTVPRIRSLFDLEIY